MSNLVILLANAYDKCRNESGNNNHNNTKWMELKIWAKKNIVVVIILAVILISASIAIVYSINGKVNIIMEVSSLIYGISIFLLVKISEKAEIKNYQQISRNYYATMNKFKNILKIEFHLYSKEKIQYLITECDKTIDVFKINNKLLDKFINVWKNAILPIITFGMGAILKLNNISATVSWVTITKGIIIAIMIVALIMGSLFAIESVINTLTNGYRKRVENLKVILTDIYIKNYM